MLGTFNLPVNIMDSQQIQMSVHQMMTGVGEAVRNSTVTTSFGSNGSVDVRINLDQIEPRVRLQLAENLLRDAQSLTHRLEHSARPHRPLPPPLPSRFFPPQYWHNKMVQIIPATDPSPMQPQSLKVSPEFSVPSSSSSGVGYHHGFHFHWRVSEHARLFHKSLTSSTYLPFSLPLSVSPFGEATSGSLVLGQPNTAGTAQAGRLMMLGEPLWNCSYSGHSWTFNENRGTHSFFDRSLSFFPICLRLTVSAGAPAQMESFPRSASNLEEAASSQPPHIAGTRVVIDRPSFFPHIPQPVGKQGTRKRVILALLHNPVSRAPPTAPSSLTQMISGLGGQLLMVGQPGYPISTSSLASCPSSISTSSSTVFPSANTSGQTSTHTTNTPSTGQPTEGSPEGQPLGSVLGGAALSITVTLTAFFQGLSDFTQPAEHRAATLVLPQSSGPPRTLAGGGSGGESLSPELFTGIVQGVLSTMISSLGAQQVSSLFSQGSGDVVGFFGDLQFVVCQSFSMIDMILLLHGNAEPLSRIQPQVTDFFNEHYLQEREPSNANIETAADQLINGLEEYIAESFATVTVRDGVDIVQTNLSFLRQQLTQMVSLILHPNDIAFGPRLLLLCTLGLFECLALNLRGEQRCLTAVITQRLMEDSLPPAPATAAEEAPEERQASPGVNPALSGDRHGARQAGEGRPLGLSHGQQLFHL
ncbi:LOW QUALITY PROTEIN: large proline-rich protein BAG6-like [Spinachia spinachia]